MREEEKQKRSLWMTLNSNSMWESAFSRGRQDPHPTKGLSLLKPLAQIVI